MNIHVLALVHTVHNDAQYNVHVHTQTRIRVYVVDIKGTESGEGRIGKLK